MAEAVGYSCDNCNKFGMKLKDDPSPHLPSGWLQVRVYVERKDTKELRSDIKDFCCSICLAQFAENRINAERGLEVGSVEEGSYCHELHKRFMTKYRKKK